MTWWWACVLDTKISQLLFSQQAKAEISNFREFRKQRFDFTISGILWQTRSFRVWKSFAMLWAEMLRGKTPILWKKRARAKDARIAALTFSSSRRAPQMSQWPLFTAVLTVHISGRNDRPLFINSSVNWKHSTAPTISRAVNNPFFFIFSHAPRRATKLPKCL